MDRFIELPKSYKEVQNLATFSKTESKRQVAVIKNAENIPGWNLYAGMGGIA